LAKYFSTPINITRISTDYGYPNYYPFNSNKLASGTTTSPPYVIGEFEIFEYYTAGLNLDQPIFITNKQITPDRVREFLSNISLHLLDPDPSVRDIATILMSWKEEK
jgi:hypothetical protein